MNIKEIDWRTKLRPLYRFATRLPPGLRSLAGLALIAAGFLGIVMPILGFWMVPLGLLFIAAEIPPLRRRVERWLADGDERGRTERPGVSSAGAGRSTDSRTRKDEPRRTVR
jgi:hypothetical protein